MPIFGQVWLWSLAAFLLGALLCWLLLVLPVRRRISSLESRLSTLRADTKRNAAADRSRGADGPPMSTPGIVPGFGDARDEIRGETLTRAYALPGVRELPSPYGDPADRGALQLSAPTEAQPRAYVPPTEDGPTSGAAGRDWFDEQPAAEGTAAHRLVDDGDGDGDDRGTVFTQRTRPIPAALIRSLDESEPDAPRQQDALVDDLAEDDPPAAVISLSPPAPPVRPDRPKRDRVRPAAAFEPAPVAKNGTTANPEMDTVDTSVEPAAVPSHRSTVAELPSRTELAEPKVSPSITVEPERTSSALPKRVPAKPRHQYHPFGVETVTPAVSMGTVSASGGERVRSLFEPIIPAEDGQTEVPPPPVATHRLQSAGSPSTSSGSASGSTGSGSRTGAPGPFGPGSAMPLPGGASPSPEFTVKASVTALRYCTSESPQFGRTVAEVWFRTAADAERVGFRPVG